ncbi:RNA polymerase sigma factor [Fuerstiella marisgermanici]|uniref:RNA polymerase sigma factor n=2 Tax=Fuerstiella marisgermanici TaxID=1891926 RepID=A0A1P8WQ98_9PLAN|nr:RNA polymerase sigma factor [Fuerstiella marisgermanici]
MEGASAFFKQLCSFHGVRPHLRTWPFAGPNSFLWEFCASCSIVAKTCSIGGETAFMTEEAIDDCGDFRDLIARVRDGDEDAAVELVNVYEPHVRRAVRIRLGAPKLRQLVDSMDISQSVLGNFFVRAVAGQFELDTPKQLVALLSRMAENRVRDWQRRHSTLRRDKGREISLTHLRQEPAAVVYADEEANPLDMLERVLKELTPEDSQLVEWRRAGDSWTEIADRTNKTPDALRMQLRRAVDRALRAVKA